MNDKYKKYIKALNYKKLQLLEKFEQFKKMVSVTSCEKLTFVILK